MQNPENTSHWGNVVSMLCHRLRRWHNIETPLGECPVFAGNDVTGFFYFYPALPPCHEKRAYVSEGLLGTYMPSCEEDGYFSATQCHGSTGRCWCTDRKGTKLPDTETMPGESMLSCEEEVEGNMMTACMWYMVMSLKSLTGFSLTLKVIYHPIYSMNKFVTNKAKLSQDGAQVFPYMGWLAIMWPSERVTW